MSTPLIMKKVDTATAVVVPGGEKRAAQPQPVGQPLAKKPNSDSSAERPPGRVLLLNNVVGKGEVDEDLEEEMAEEAGKYGKLKKCVIKEYKELGDNEAVRIFMEYENVEGATKALIDMNGRFFGGRTVKARFYDEARFGSGDFEKKDGLE